MDRRAIAILNELGADVAWMDRVFDEVSQLSWAIRAKMMDGEICKFLARYPAATIVNIGAGLDTTFDRVDNGRIRWYDLDLPEVIELRRKLLPETARNRCIPKSVLDLSWFDDIDQPEEGVFFLACGVLPYFRENEIRRLFADMALRFLRAEIVFDAPSKLFRWVTNWSVLRRSGMGRDTLMKWGVSAAGDIAKSDKRVQVLDEYPWFSRIEMDAGWGNSTVNTMKWTNRLHALNIFHFRFGS